MQEPKLSILISKCETIIHQCFTEDDNVSIVLSKYRRKILAKDRYDECLADILRIITENEDNFMRDDVKWICSKAIRIGETAQCCIPLSIICNKAIKQGKVDLVHDLLEYIYLFRLKKQINGRVFPGSSEESTTEESSEEVDDPYAKIKVEAFHASLKGIRQELCETLQKELLPPPSTITYTKSYAEKKEKNIELIRSQIQKIDEILSTGKSALPENVSQK